MSRFFDNTYVKPLERSFLPGFVRVDCDCGSKLHVNSEALPHELSECHCGRKYQIINGKAVKVRDHISD